MDALMNTGTAFKLSNATDQSAFCAGVIIVAIPGSDHGELNGSV